MLEVSSIMPPPVMLIFFFVTATVDLVAAGDPDDLTWSFTGNGAALCNDYTPAGFFHRNLSASVTEKKWVIVLESGSLCHSNDTCNRRYFQSHLRTRFSSGSRSRLRFGDFDTAVAWAETGAAGQPLTEVVNPLMTSPYCFRNETQYFSDADNLSVEGRDILSSDCRENPTFWSHGHVLVPYCSSDLWLGSDERHDQQCDCWDQDCFRYNPTSEDLQFTFRGQTIFRSVLQTLDRLYNLKTASEIVLVGSSAGGVGVLNSAKWVRDTFQNVSLKVITDSSWFINFRNSLVEVFGTDTANSAGGSQLFDLLDSNEACNDTRLGYPCCVSSPCILQERSPVDDEYYFPRDVPLFSLSGLYDIFLLSNSLSRLGDLDDPSLTTVGFAQDLIITIGEYGGALNTSILDIASRGSRNRLPFTYFSPQCFQHRYLATSSLAEPGNLFGSEDVTFSHNVVTFRHTARSGVWNSPPLGYYEGEGYTIRDAIDYWYWNVSDKGEGVAFRDECSGPHCSNSCPEEIVLVSQRARKWSKPIIAVIAVVVLLFAAVCLVLKLYWVVWSNLLQRKQQKFLDGALQGPTLSAKRKFPSCTDEEAISVACLDLHYYVTVHENLKKRQEQKETHLPMALGDLHDEEDDTDFTESSHRTENASRIKRLLGTKTKTILSGVSAYFNPGELIAIMGPSGSGKTTLLDLLTGRRKSSTVDGNVFVNGLPLEENQNWYLGNMGYVLQLAVPYYEELTVRENLTLAAWVKLHISSREKFQRVEQVMEVTGLMDLADTVVGGATGPGLSGGQKRRLVVSLQLLKLPSVIFLDEPTSGLDSASSTQLLTHLNDLADSNRTVVLTIHQPRLEIFHMFHRIILLSEGKVAYHGAPEKAYEVFVNALQSTFLSQELSIPPLEDHNPADVIMDMLEVKRMRKIIYKYYEGSGGDEMVRTAVHEARQKELHIFNGEQKHGLRLGTRRVGRIQNTFVSRLAALEVRAVKRTNLLTLLYLPIIFFGYSFLLGSVYYQTSTPFLIMSGFCVYSVASALFMFPALYPFYVRALEIYTFEHADGAGRATDLVIQPFVRFISMAFFPVIIGASVLYFVLVESSRWDTVELFQIALVNIALNQTWTALLIWLILTFQKKSLRLSPVLSAVAGFTSGFFIPINDIPPWYRWMSFINPNYYGFSASAVILLSDFESDCERDGGSELECYTASGDYTLAIFDFNTVNPYQNIVILLSMTLFFLVMAGVSNWARYLELRRIRKLFKLTLEKLLKRSQKPELQVQQEMQQTKKMEATLQENVENENSTTSSSTGIPATPGLKRKNTFYLNDDQAHTVWKHDVSLQSAQNRRNILERRKQLQNRVWATQQVLSVQREFSCDEASGSDTSPCDKRIEWRKAIRDCARNTPEKLSSGVEFHDIISQYAAAAQVGDGSMTDEPKARVTARNSLRQWRRQFSTNRQPASRPAEITAIDEEQEEL